MSPISCLDLVLKRQHKIYSHMLDSSEVHKGEMTPIFPSISLVDTSFQSLRSILRWFGGTTRYNGNQRRNSGANRNFLLDCFNKTQDDGSCLLLLTSYDFIISEAPYYLELHSTIIYLMMWIKSMSFSNIDKSKGTETTREHAKSNDFFKRRSFRDKCAWANRRRFRVNFKRCCWWSTTTLHWGKHPTNNQSEAGLATPEKNSAQ